MAQERNDVAFITRRVDVKTSGLLISPFNNIAIAEIEQKSLVKQNDPRKFCNLPQRVVLKATPVLFGNLGFIR